MKRMESSNGNCASSVSTNSKIHSGTLIEKKKVSFTFFPKKKRSTKSKQKPAQIVVSSQKDPMISPKRSRFHTKDVDTLVADALKLNLNKSQTLSRKNYEVTSLNGLPDDTATVHSKDPSSSCCQGISLILALFYDAFLCRHFSIVRKPIEGHAQPYDEASSLFLESIDRGEIPSGLEEMVSCAYHQGKILVEIWDYRSTQEKCPRTSKSLPSSILSSSILPTVWRTWLSPTNRMVLEDLQKRVLLPFQQAQDEHLRSELTVVSSLNILMEQKFLEMRYPLDSFCFDPSPKVSEVASILNATLNVKGQNARFLRSEDYLAYLGQQTSKFEPDPNYEDLLQSYAPVKTPKNAMQMYKGTSSETTLEGQRRSSSGILFSPKEEKHRIVASQLPERAGGLGLGISKVISMNKKKSMKRKRVAPCVMPKLSTKKNLVVQSHSLQFKPRRDDPLRTQCFLQAAQTFQRHRQLSYKLNWKAVIDQAMSKTPIGDKTIPGSMNSLADQMGPLQSPTQIIIASKSREVQRSQNGADFQLDLNDIFWEPLLLSIPSQPPYPVSHGIQTVSDKEILKMEPLPGTGEGFNLSIDGEIPLLDINDPLMDPIYVIDPISSQHPVDLSMAHGLKL